MGEHPRIYQTVEKPPSLGAPYAATEQLVDGSRGVRRLPYPTGGSGYGGGYIGLIGGEVKLTDAISGVTEFDFEKGFGPFHASNGYDVQTDVKKVTVGLRIDFDALQSR